MADTNFAAPRGTSQKSPAPMDVGLGSDTSEELDSHRLRLIDEAGIELEVLALQQLRLLNSPQFPEESLHVYRGVFLRVQKLAIVIMSAIGDPMTPTEDIEADLVGRLDFLGEAA